MENEVKEPAPKYNFISPEEYLKRERSSTGRHEYYEGQVFAISGASLNHNRIERNLITAIGNFLHDSECEVLPSHMRISTPLHESYMYPDVLIVCGKPELEGDKFDTLTNPSVIFEILSPSTKTIDEERKLFFYRQIPSLKEYIMIDSVKRKVLVVRKQIDESWKFEDIEESTAHLNIYTINFKLLLETIYKNTGL
jgi:Uma2 family endonuclease